MAKHSPTSRTTINAPPYLMYLSIPPFFLTQCFIGRRQDKIYVVVGSCNATLLIAPYGVLSHRVKLSEATKQAT